MIEFFAWWLAISLILVVAFIILLALGWIGFEVRK